MSFCCQRQFGKQKTVSINQLYSQQQGGYLAGWLLQPLPQIDQQFKKVKCMQLGEHIEIEAKESSQIQPANIQEALDAEFMTSTKLDFNRRGSNIDCFHEQWLLSQSKVYQIGSLDLDKLAPKEGKYYEMHQTTDYNMIERFIDVLEYQNNQAEDHINYLFKMIENSLPKYTKK
ncbi:hypothetical protein SS50377_26378 [Spironucleus salmonicida]|uniref:Uncharacterized protein n=1 Tax=Spironucleus salmonicida TaxID=348837 RepID=V6LT52_9EUKA|nr:hypothetical protein SS50377_26378 [Spironucleus salmonicida]|eukprot:EST47755.1 Hypothetical protein SS50377_12154 [Spironucleus salmonicida]